MDIRVPELFAKIALTEIVPCQTKKTLTKKQKNTYDGANRRKPGNIVIRWVDNNVISVALTCHGILPLSKVKRYSFVQKTMNIFPPLFLISKYSAYIGGTDLMDEIYPDTNAWKLHRKYGGKLEFRREIAICYLQSFEATPKHGRRPKTSRTSLSLNIISDERYDGINHLVVEVLAKKKENDAQAKALPRASVLCATSVTWAYVFHAFVYISYQANFVFRIFLHFT